MWHSPLDLVLFLKFGVRMVIQGWTFDLILSALQIGLPPRRKKLFLSLNIPCFLYSSQHRRKAFRNAVCDVIQKDFRPLYQSGSQRRNQAKVCAWNTYDSKAKTRRINRTKRVSHIKTSCFTRRNVSHDLKIGSAVTQSMLRCWGHEFPTTKWRNLLLLYLHLFLKTLR